MVYKDPRIDKDVARELNFYISNDGLLYRQMTRPIIIMLSKRKVNGTYNKELAIKAWENLVKEGITKYSKEVGKIVANPATRNEAAKQLADEWSEEMRDTVAKMTALKKAGKAWSLKE